MTNILKQAQFGQAYATYPFGRNRIINGDMRIDQRNSGSAVTTTSGSPATIFPVDRFKIYSEAISGTISGQRLSGDGPTGFPNYLRVKITTAGTIAPSGPLYLAQVIEGYNISDFQFGSASASNVALSFWYRSSVSGLHSGAVKSGDGLRTYPFSFTVNSANTWEYKTIPIPGDVTGTWATDNTAGMYVVFNIGSGSSKTGTAGSWTTSQVWGVTGAAYLLGTLNATIDVTGVQLEIGNVATSFERLQYGTQFEQCRRYARVVRISSGICGSTSVVSLFIPHEGMRTSPVVTATGVLTVTDTQASYTQSSASASVINQSIDGTTANLSNFTGLTVYRPCALYNSNPILLTAEL